MAQYKSFTLTPDPPTHAFPHLTRQLSTSTAQTILASYLSRATIDPALHPDAWLSTGGVKFGPRGSGGGLTMHHLSRIEAGLRGEDLASESREELVAKFGEEERGGRVGGEGLPAGDDSRVDAAISERKSRKRKRGEEIEAWAKESADGMTEIGVRGEDGGDEGGWMAKEEYEQSQTILEGEVGERDAAATAEQGTAPPAVVTHEADGDVHVPKKPKTAEEKAARKAAKKAKRKEEKAQAKANKATVKAEDG